MGRVIALTMMHAVRLRGPEWLLRQPFWSRQPFWLVLPEVYFNFGFPGILSFPAYSICLFTVRFWHSVQFDAVDLTLGWPFEHGTPLARTSPFSAVCAWTLLVIALAVLRLTRKGRLSRVGFWCLYAPCKMPTMLGCQDFWHYTIFGFFLKANKHQNLARPRHLVGARIWPAGFWWGQLWQNTIMSGLYGVLFCKHWF